VIGPETAGPAGQPGVGFAGAQTTGRRVVVFAEPNGAADPAETLRSIAGVSEVASTRDFAGQAVDLTQIQSAGATVFAELGVAVVAADADQAAALEAAASSRGAILSVEPELVHHIMGDAGGGTARGGRVAADYVRGYRDGVGDLSGRIVPGTAGAAGGLPAAEIAGYQDTDRFTWGLQATEVAASSSSGQGVKVAVLDTGFDLTHPDFTGRAVTAQSFVAGASPQDGHGHGTHCIGTACGPQTLADSRRYGVGYEVGIFVGKVLDDQGSGVDQGILAGINWAVANGCQVLSMSLGADVQRVSRAYETVGRRALAAGSLIVAAAGNTARRDLGNFGFVGVPANSPSIMAVAAVDAQLDIAYFSARSNPARGGQVDIAGPGVDVYSAWPMPTRYNTISGTSMATPHASGIAALWCQMTGHRARDLWSTLTQQGRRLSLPSVDVGAGLVQAPQ
jgi:subtilisin family serine protease